MAGTETGGRRRAGRGERWIRAATALAGASLTLALGLLALQRAGWTLVSLSYDLPFVIHSSGFDDDLRVVFLDKLDGEHLDRRSQAALIDKLAAGGARGAVYDIIFDRPSDDPAVDRDFAAALRRFRGVDESGEPLPGATRRQVILACGRKTFQVPGAAGEELAPPTDVLLDAVDDFGLSAFDEEMFMARRLTTGTRDEPSLGWQAAQALGAGLDEGRRLDGRWLNFTGRPADGVRPPPIPTCSASSVLEGKVGPGFFAGKVVVIGGEPGIVGEALGKDLFATPFHRFQVGGRLPLFSGVELQAQALENLLHHKWLIRSVHRFDVLLVAWGALLAGAGLALLRPGRAITLGLLAILGLIAAGVFTVHFQRWWFPWSVVAFLQVPVALVWGSGAHFYVERFFRLKLGEEQRALREAFAKYVSPQMLDRLTERGFDLQVGGETIEAAIMFTDIEGFTELCEVVGDPAEIVHNLNDYFERTTHHIFDHDGVVIKFIGDAIFAAWGAPIADPEARLKAVRAAWNVHLQSRFVVRGNSLRTRLGLHFGEVVAGNIGSAKHVDYTLIGDAVNSAARLEGLNKQLHTSILLTDTVQQQLGGEFLTRRVGRFMFKGRRSATTVHELLGPNTGQPLPDWARLHEQAAAQLEAGHHPQARELFARADAARAPAGDGPARFFLAALDRGDPLAEGVVDLLEK